jgi:hypothetical protein
MIRAKQVKNLYLGKDHVGDAPLYKKIAAGLTTGQIALFFLDYAFQIVVQCRGSIFITCYLYYPCFTSVQGELQCRSFDFCIRLCAVSGSLL